MDNSTFDDFGGYGIAIVGMATRVPGAQDPEKFWTNLCKGVESVTFFSDEEMAAAGVRPEQMRNPHYVKAGAHLEGMSDFDPEFFGFSPKEAGILDPQHRQFYECCWEALERAGHPPSRFDGAIGVYAGSGMAAYLAQNLMTNPALVDSVGMFLLRHTGNDKDFLATRVSYCLNLKGPSVNVQTACSTSSVATHMACQALLSEECDMALAGGVTIELPHDRGYLYKEGEILSPDGHCRAFDHRAKGTIFGSGTGVVVLRRLEDAIADGDHIHAVIVGSAVNNDGASKVGYLAPSVEGQAEAITEALEIAEVSADSIGYVECHGTGTPVGDPIEVAALTAAFAESTERKGFCGIGSVKTNIGHLDTAAGVASIIKTSLALQHKKLPPSLNYEAPNPTIDFARSPFYVNDTLQDWPQGETPRRAGVNSLGVGGTNAFLLLEEAPEQTPSEPHTDSHFVLPLSAKNRKSLDAYMEKLALHLQQHPDLCMADVAYTLLEGREAWEHRRVLAVRSREEAIDLLQNPEAQRVYSHTAEADAQSLVFMFPGGGAQYVNMARDLYHSEAVLQQHLDAGFAYLQAHTGADYRALLFADASNREQSEQALQQPSVQLPLIFLVEYALAQLWMAKGVQPKALIGHSMGENTAACIAGILSFEDALGLVLLRGQLMDKVPKGGMLSVQLSATELEPHLHERLALAAVNSPLLSVVSGTQEDLQALSEKLTALDIDNKRVRIDIAAHSWLLDQILPEFAAYLAKIRLSPPKIPCISNFTGTWMTAAEATSPEYWVKHLRNTVRFADGIDTLLQEEGRIFIEVGPGNTLGSLTRQNPRAPSQRVFASLRHAKEEIADDTHFYTVFGRLWAAGLPISAEQMFGDVRRLRIPLPTYAFNHKPYFIAPGRADQPSAEAFSALQKLPELRDWYRKPVWVQKGVLAQPCKPSTWLIFLDDLGVGQRVANTLRHDGHKVVTVREGDAYYQKSQEEYILSPESGLEAYSTLVSDLQASGHFPDRLLHLWLLTHDESFRPGSSFLHRNQEHGFYSLFFFARALADGGLADRQLHMLVVGNGFQKVAKEAVLYPEKATVLGPAMVIPREFAAITVACFDVDIPLKPERSGLFSRKPDLPEIPADVMHLLGVEIYAEAQSGIFAYRDGVRWQREYDRVKSLEDSLNFDFDPASQRLRKSGVYLITGGLGGIGYEIAQVLAKQHNARLVLVNRTPLPPRTEWANWLRQHGYSDRISVAISKVRQLEELGADVVVHSGDVTDAQRMQEILHSVEQQWGDVHGVIHAAGNVNDGLIQMKNQGDIEEVFAPKVYGTLVLDELFAGKRLDFFVVFSSTSTVIAPVGQVDYVAANAFLNAYAQQRNQLQPGYSVAINWGVWNEVGMAAEAAAKMGYSADSAKAEVVNTHYPWFEQHQRTTHNGRDTHTFSAHFQAKKHWVIDQHRTQEGQALLPGTAYLELARAALRESGESEAFSIRELVFLQALYVPEGETVEVRVKLTQTVEGYNFALQSEVPGASDDTQWQTHAEARVVLGVPSIEQVPSFEDVQSSLPLALSADMPPAQPSAQEAHMDFGPRWQVLREVRYEQHEALARLHLEPTFAQELNDFALHPALLDIATGYAMPLIKGYGQQSSELWVPVSYAHFAFHRPLTATLYSWVRNHASNSVDEDFASFDVCLFDEKGQLLVQVEKLTIKKMTGQVDFSASSRAAAPARMELEKRSGARGDVEFRQLSPAEMAFQHNLSQGILPAEGAQALLNVLTRAQDTQVIISSLDLQGLIREVDATAAKLNQQEDETSFARPELDTDYVAPSDDIERTLVGFWQELLGVDQVGVEDSFFDLGGHSLVAVRLFAKIQQVYDVDYPISILFEAPTVAACADLLREVVGETPESSASNESEAPKEKTHKARYTHLVPMHSSRSSGLTPFFLVAGMFGNVLNLRHLAQLIGHDRPFYGLQARGLYGDHAPHETFEDMARDYIAELKTVQPQGPYIIGGFSGGGITAFEMARQLKAAGDEVAELIFLDTPLPYNDPLSSVDRMSIHWQRLQTNGLSYFAEWAKNRYQWELNKFRKRFADVDDAQAGNPAEFKSGRMEIAFYNALARYQIAPQTIAAKLFRPKLPVKYTLSGGRVANKDRQLIYEDNGWPRYVESLDVFEVPGDHDSMVLEPNVRVLAAKLRECIDAADPKMR